MGEVIDVLDDFGICCCAQILCVRVEIDTLIARLGRFDEQRFDAVHRLFRLAGIGRVLLGLVLAFADHLHLDVLKDRRQQNFLHDVACDRHLIGGQTLVVERQQPRVGDVGRDDRKVDLVSVILDFDGSEPCIARRSPLGRELLYDGRIVRADGFVGFDRTLRRHELRRGEPPVDVLHEFQTVPLRRIGAQLLFQIIHVNRGCGESRKLARGQSFECEAIVGCLRVDREGTAFASPEYFCCGRLIFAGFGEFLLLLL